MATNPMQRKARISFFLGMLVTLILCGTIIALLILQINNYKEKEKKAEAQIKTVYVLKENVASGGIITSDMYEEKNVNIDMVPDTAIDNDELESYTLVDKSGYPVHTQKDENGDTITNEDGNAKKFIERDGEQYEVFEEENSYYIMYQQQKTALELNVVPVLAKVDLKANTVLTKELLTRGKDTLADDVRRQEYNMFILPMDLKTGDYIDLRLMLPTGEDFIVVAKKMVTIPVIGSEQSTTTVWLNVGEDEILTISSAIIDAYKMTGSKLYATKYTEPGIQKDATPTYVASNDTIKLIKKDPNILQRASTELTKRYNSIGYQEIRVDHIDKVINSTTEEENNESVRSKMTESINGTQDSRRRYLDSIGGE